MTPRPTTGWKPATRFSRLHWRLRPVTIALTAPWRWLRDRLRRRVPPPPPRRGWPPPAGVREPRRPVPSSGAGAAALPEPRD